MTYEEIKIQLDISDPCEVLKSAGRQYGTKWFVVCDNGDCHLFDKHGKELDIEHLLDAIEDYAFYGYESLKSISIPHGVKSIDDWAFANCTSLASIKIPSSVSSIGEGVFYWCASLKSIDIPSDVKSIG